MERALAGLRKYQEAPRPPAPSPMPAIAAVEGASLRDYGGDGPPLLIVPSLINPPTVLDLGKRSLLRWLATQDRRVLLVDWGWPDETRKALSVAGHVEQVLLPLMEVVGAPVDLAGYCLGGTMAAAAAQLGPVRSLALIATPWHFAGFGESRAQLARLWAQSRATVDALGLMPMEVLQSAFWGLDPARTVAKFEAFAEMDGPAADAFVALEDWANDGPPLTAAAARELMEDFFAADLPGIGGWRVSGEIIDPARLEVPILNIVSTTDRIVPYASAVQAGERIDLALGHVGMVVGSRARDALWEPLASWLSRTAAK
ncbi:alpha/beta fold hydrolase [Sphingosinicella sp. LHD-64]|uniref:alpha/beta fold hydrolase n=1 Tax=Sphingosinicella sp. LHD-64 TaxID=3072139 RepID=UPI00280CAE52|nr:alpha/beta fold hydrolase [Sphingosinicella sp. LHD-64]MDQ8757274.1 alpha/beta fold hydrolase [Sphingosinicella sp. LHD-64]